MPPPPPLPVPDLLRQASARLTELADRADQLADAGTSCFNDQRIELAVDAAKQILAIHSPV